MTLYVEIRYVQRVLLDEFAPRFDRIAHQRRKDVIGRHGIFDAHLHQTPALRIDRRIPELARVHLAQALVALDALTLLGLIEQPVDRDLEARDFLTLVAAHDVRPGSHEIVQGLRELGDSAVFGGMEKLPRNMLLGRESVLGALQGDASPARGERLDDDPITARYVVERIESMIELPAPIAQRIGAVEGFRREFRQVEQLLEEAFVVAPCPALHDVLNLDVFARQRFQSQARHRRSVGIDVQRSSIDGRAQQQGVELEIVLDVVFLLALLDLVERRLSDVDVAALDEDRHLPIEERQQQSTDVRTIDVGIGHDDDAVIAQLFDIEVVAPYAAAQRGDQRTDFG